MNPDDIKSCSNSDFDKENNKEDPKFIVGDYVRISKFKDIFAKFYVPNWSEEYFVIKRVIKNTLMVKIFLERFTKKESKKANQAEFRVEKVIKKKGDKVI